MAGWHPRLNGHDSEKTPGDGEGRGGLARCRRVESQRAGHDLATEQRQQPVSEERMMRFILTFAFSIFSSSFLDFFGLILKKQHKGHRLNAIGTALLQESDCPRKMSLVFQI